MLWALVFSRASRSSPAPLLGIIPSNLIGVSNQLSFGIETLNRNRHARTRGGK